MDQGIVRANEDDTKTSDRVKAVDFYKLPLMDFQSTQFLYVFPPSTSEGLSESSAEGEFLFLPGIIEGSAPAFSERRESLFVTFILYFPWKYQSILSDNFSRSDLLFKTQEFSGIKMVIPFLEYSSCLPTGF